MGIKKRVVTVTVSVVIIFPQYFSYFWLLFLQTTKLVFLYQKSFCCYKYNRAVGTGRRGRSPDRLSQSGGQIMPTTLLLAPPDFHSFLRHCVLWELTFTSATSWKKLKVRSLRTHFYGDDVSNFLSFIFVKAHFTLFSN